MKGITQLVFKYFWMEHVAKILLFLLENFFLYVLYCELLLSYFFIMALLIIYGVVVSVAARL